MSRSALPSRRFCHGRGFVGLVLALALSAQAAQAAGLTLNISDTGFDPIPAGGTIEYQVRVQNGGNTRSASDTLVFTIPTGATYTGTSGDLTGCTPAPPQTGLATVSCPVPDLAPRGQFAGTVNLVPDASGTVTLEAALPGEGISGNQTTTVTAGADLELSFQAPADIRAGEILTFEAVITNNGPYPADGTTFTTLLPAALSDQITLPPDCSISGNTITCDVTGPIPVGDSVSLPFSTQVLTDNQSNVAVAGSIAGTTPPDPDLSNDAASFGIIINPGTDLKLQKTRTPSGLLYVGQDVTFALVPQFVGNVPLEAAISDTLPANYALVSVTPSGAGWSCNAVNPVACTYSSATEDAAGYGAPIQIVATPVTETAAGAPVTNTAEISGPVDVRPDNNTASDGGADIVTPATDLVAHKSGPAHGLATVGNSYDWQIWTGNIGNIGFAGTLELTDHLPAGLELTGISAPAGWSCAPTAATGPADILCTSSNYTELAPLAVGAVTPAITLTTTVLVEGAISNGLTVGYSDENFPDRDLSNNTTQSGVTAGDGNTVGIADLRLQKSVADAGPHLSGEPVSFTITVFNDGTDAAGDVRILDRLSDLYFADSVTTAVTLDSVPGDVTCSVTRGAGFYSDLSCTIATLAANESRAITLTALAGGEAGAKTNTAETYSTQTPDPDFSNNTDSAGYGVTARTDVTVEKTASHADMAEVKAGQPLIYILSASVPGNGLSAANDVIVTDLLPAGLRVVSTTPSQGSCQPVTGLVDGITTASSQLICDLGTIANGNTQTVEVTVVPTTAIAGTTITNPVTVATSTPETDATNNADDISHQITRPALDLVTNKTDGPDPVELGQTTTYTVTVQNAGPSEAFNLTIRDILPAAGMRYESVAATSPGLICAPTTAIPGNTGGEIECALPNLPVGDTASFQVEMTAMQRGQWVNRVEARSDEYADETITANNDVDETTTVFERSNLRVTKAASQNPVDLNEPFSWTITVENVTATGIGLAENVVLTDTLPAGMEIFGAVTASGSVGASCDAPIGGRDLICIIDDMSAGDNLTVTLPVRVTSVVANPETASNSATVSTDSFDENPANNTDTGTVDVKSTSVSGAIWRDFDESDSRDANDSGIGGLSVSISGTDAFGNPVNRTTTTGADGSYDFALLPPGDYSISYSPPTGDTYQQGSALPGATGGGVVNTPIRIDNITADTETPSDENDFTLIPQAKLALAKQVSAPAFQADGSYRLTYTFRIRNESQEPIENLALTDHLLTSFGTYVTAAPDHGEFRVVSVTGGALAAGADTQLDLTVPTVAAGATATVTMILQVNPALPRTGATATHTNNATIEGDGAWSVQSPADGSNNGSTPQHGVTSNTSRDVTFAPAIMLHKTAFLDNGGATAAPGDVVLYAFSVENTGNTPLVDVTLTDPMPGLVWDTVGPITRLDPGQLNSIAFTAHYVLTQADIEAGGVANTATASGRWAVDGVTDPIVSDSDDASLDALAEPGLSVVKAEVSNTVQTPTLPGDSIRYSFVVTNTGNVELHDLELTDVLAGIAPDPAGSFIIGTLARAGEAGDSVTLYADFTVTQDDIDAGEVVNAASVSGTHGPDETPVNADSNEVTTPLAQARDMLVTKLPDTPLPTAPQEGDTITWTITIENTGNTRLEIGTIAEALAGATVSAPAQPVLAPGASTTASASYTLTQADIDAGAVLNQVTVSGKIPVTDTPFDDTPSGNDPDTPNEDKTETPLPALPEIALLKELTSDVSAPLLSGDVIGFDFTIRNTGNVTLTDLALTDHLAGVSVDDAALTGLSLAPGDDVVLAGTYTLTDADIEAGGLDNTATVTGNDPHGTPVTDDSGTDFDNDDPTEVPLIRNPEIALIKTISAAPPAPVVAGDVIEYAFEVRNTGNVALRDIALTDLVGGVTVTGSRAAPLPVGGVDTASFSGSYVLTQTDIDAGIFANTAEVTGTGTGPGGAGIEVSDVSGSDLGNDDPTELEIAPAPALEIVKSADDAAIQSPAQAGDEITYSFTVENTGNVTLTNVAVTDPLLGGVFAGNTVASLAPGASATVSATYAITQADIEAGLVLNTAEVTGDYFDRDSGTTETTPSEPSEEVAVPLDQGPHLAVVKTASSAISDPAEVGQEITYTFTVRNLGNVEITGVELTDPLPGLAPSSFTLGDMEAGTDQTVSATYAITQADIDAGRVVNQATASGTHAGDPVSDLSGPDSASDEETVVPVPQGPALHLVKAVDASAISDPAVPGQEIRYSFTVTNSGNVTLHNVTVSDPLPGLAPASFDLGTLAPGAEATVGPASYAITQADITAGKVENRALASGSYGPPGDPGTVEAPSETEAGIDGPVVTPISGVPAIALVKTLDPAIDPDSLRLGDEIRWNFAVTNTGNVPLTNVTLREEMVDATVSGGPVALEPGQTDSSSFTASHRVTQADLDAGSIVNQARASGLFDNGTDPAQEVSDLSGTTLDDDEPTRTGLVQRPAIDLVKTADTSGLAAPPQAGDEVRYAFTITNTGEVTLRDVTLTDAMAGLVLSGDPIPSLAPGASNATAYSASYVLTQQDIDSGRTVENQAEVTGQFTDPSGGPGEVSDLSGTEAGTDQPTVVEFERAPSLVLEKIADDTGISEVAQVGEQIAYTFRLTNTGNVTLTDVTVDDPLPGLVLTGAPIASLAPGEISAAITGTYALTPADIVAAERPNTAQAAGLWTPDGGSPQQVPSNESSALVELGYPEIALEISVGELRDLNGDGRMGPGDLVFFRFMLTNTGTVPLNDAGLDMGSLSLPLAGLVCAPVRLEVGASAFLECTGGAYTITAQDVDVGKITLTGDAVGTSDAGVTVRASSAASTIPDIGAGALTLEKLALVETAMVGDLVPYEIRIGSDTQGVPVSARLVDTLPEGFSYQAGSARLDGVAVELEVRGRSLVLDPLTLAPGQTRVLRLEARVGSSVQPGSHLNRARLLSGTTGVPIAPGRFQRAQHRPQSFFPRRCLEADDLVRWNFVPIEVVFAGPHAQETALREVSW